MWSPWQFVQAWQPQGSWGNSGPRRSNKVISKGAEGDLIIGPPDEREVRGQRRLNTSEQVETLIEELKKLGDSDKPFLKDLDLSQNKIPPSDFEAIFRTLVSSGISVQRFRMFGCPTLNDEVLGSLCDLLAACTAENAPTELHLSDCAITSDGFSLLLAAVESNDAFPLDRPPKKKLPLYVRLEGNYIDEAEIQEKVTQGVIRKLVKTYSTKLDMAFGDAKINLLTMRGQSGFSQKTGPPPEPEDAKEENYLKDVWMPAWKKEMERGGKGGVKRKLEDGKDGDRKSVV